MHSSYDVCACMVIVIRSIIKFRSAIITCDASRYAYTYIYVYVCRDTTCCYGTYYEERFQ